LKKPLASDPGTGIDLHLHSTASDGSLTPPEIVSEALRIGLKAIAITDHDTLAGSSAALSCGLPSSLQVLSGVEISAAAPDGFPVKGSVHILGYGVVFDNPKLNALLETLKQSRENRTPKIIKRLNAVQIPLDEAELAAIVGDGMAGRPHIAQLMIKKGIVTSVDEAFDRYLGKNKPAYVGKYRVPMKDTIEAIGDAGGIAVLAHPFLYGLNDPDTFEAFLETLKSMGLKGIEAIYPAHDQETTDRYCRLASIHNLLITGGTDFHGEVTPNIKMGVGDGHLHVPYEIFEKVSNTISRDNNGRTASR
jgi:predicted metal-dependent phosphoesterase TrpH